MDWRVPDMREQAGLDYFDQSFEGSCVASNISWLDMAAAAISLHFPCPSNCAFNGPVGSHDAPTTGEPNAAVLVVPAVGSFNLRTWWKQHFFTALNFLTPKAPENWSGWKMLEDDRSFLFGRSCGKFSDLWTVKLPGSRSEKNIFNVFFCVLMEAQPGFTTSIGGKLQDLLRVPTQAA